MQVARLAVRRSALPSVRCLATATAGTVGSTTSTTSPSFSSSSSSSVIPLSNVEAQWEQMSKEDQLVVHQQLEELQKKDWKTLSIDEKKAGALSIYLSLSLSLLIREGLLTAYYVAFGPHGPRRPIHPPGSVLKIALGTVGCIAAATVLWSLTRHYGEIVLSIYTSLLFLTPITTKPIHHQKR
jgi:cytochrome c oxidase subunit 4